MTDMLRLEGENSLIAVAQHETIFRRATDTRYPQSTIGVGMNDDATGSDSERSTAATSPAKPGYWVTDPQSGREVKVHAGENAAKAIDRDRGEQLAARRKAAPAGKGTTAIGLTAIIVIAAVVIGIIVAVVHGVATSGSGENAAYNACQDVWQDRLGSTGVVSAADKESHEEKGGYLFRSTARSANGKFYVECTVTGDGADWTVLNSTVMLNS